MKKLADTRVIGEAIRETEAVYVVKELGKHQDPQKWSAEKTRNETDLIRTRLKRTIEQDLRDDPYAQQVFSELLAQAIQEAEAMFDHPLQQYALFKNLEGQLEQRRVPGIPEVLANKPYARAYYGVFRVVLGDAAFETMTQDNAYIDQALMIDDVVNTAVAEHSLNPQHIEAEIRKGLLPRLFKQLGMERAKQVIERVLHITRVGLVKEREAAR